MVEHRRLCHRNLFHVVSFENAMGFGLVLQQICTSTASAV
jgi:hypothetical protein